MKAKVTKSQILEKVKKLHAHQDSWDMRRDLAINWVSACAEFGIKTISFGTYPEDAKPIPTEIMKQLMQRGGISTAFPIKYRGRDWIIVQFPDELPLSKRLSPKDEIAFITLAPAEAFDLTC